MSAREQLVPAANKARGITTSRQQRSAGRNRNRDLTSANKLGV